MYQFSKYKSVVFERDPMSVQERLCGSSLTHVEHCILYNFFEFHNHPDAYVSKTTNPGPCFFPDKHNDIMHCVLC